MRVTRAALARIVQVDVEHRSVPTAKRGGNNRKVNPPFTVEICAWMAVASHQAVKIRGAPTAVGGHTRQWGAISLIVDHRQVPTGLAEGRVEILFIPLFIEHSRRRHGSV